MRVLGCQDDGGQDDKKQPCDSNRPVPNRPVEFVDDDQQVSVSSTGTSAFLVAEITSQANHFLKNPGSSLDSPSVLRQSLRPAKKNDATYVGRTETGAMGKVSAIFAVFAIGRAAEMKLQLLTLAASATWPMLPASVVNLYLPIALQH